MPEDESDGEDPASAAKRAVQGGSGGSTPTPQSRKTGSQTPDSSDSGGSKGSNRTGLRDYARAAMNDEAEGPEVEEVQSDYDLTRGPAHMLRSVLRTAGCIDLPPVGEFVYGSVLWAKTFGSDDAEATSEDDESAAQDDATDEQGDGEAAGIEGVPAA